tara:strand:- start:1502 stop:1762 length:261 start_codon:yes stop_codon:yes gene_type:complete
MDASTWAVFVIFFLLAALAFGFIFAVTRSASNSKYSEWRGEVDEWNKRNPKKKSLRGIPIVSSILQITNLFSSDPFPSMRPNSEEE